MSDTTQVGTLFERDVANLYRMLGYEVEGSQDLEGFQIDLVASRRIPGANEARLMIECKFKTAGTVSNEELSKLSNTFTEVGRSNGFHLAVMVTNAEFSPKARAFAAKRSYLILKTVKQLEAETLDTYSAFGRFKRDYTASAIRQLYVPLQATGEIPGKAASTNERFENIEQSLISWIDNGPPGFLTLMADFGAGKTTLLERIKFHYCDLYLHGKTAVKPLLFKAKDLHKYDDIDEFLIATVHREFRATADIGFIWQLIQQGAFLILIDGFDEVAQQIDAKQRRANFARLSALFATPSFSILTCRPTFFIDRAEYDEVVNEVVSDRRQLLGISDGDLHIDRSHDVAWLTYDLIRSYGGHTAVKHFKGLTVGRVELLPFTKRQIDLYLQQRDGEFRAALDKGWEEVRQLLEDVYDIKDLMQRPILIYMVVRTVLAGGILSHDGTQRLGASEIYEAYIRALLAREHEERETRRSVSAQARQSLLEIVAITLYQNNSMDVGFSDVANAIAARQRQLDELHGELQGRQLEHIAADIVLTGFLTQEADGKFRFAHKSFLEFLVARFLARQVIRNTLDKLGKTELPRDIVYFLASFLTSDSILREKLKSLLNEEIKDAGEWKNNIARAIISSATLHRGFDLRNLHISGITTQRIHWKSMALRDVSFSLQPPVQQQFESCRLVNVKTINSSGKIRLLEGTTFTCEIQNSDLDTVEASHSSGRIDIDESHIAAIKISSSVVELSLANVVANEVTLQNSSINVSSGELRAAHAVIRDCHDSALKRLAYYNLEISNSKLMLDEIPVPITEAEVCRMLKVDRLDDKTKFALSVRHSHLEQSAFAGRLELKEADLIRTEGFILSRLAGLRIEDCAARANLWPGCEGVLFYDTEETLFPSLLNFWHSEGAMIFVNRRAFIQHYHVADAVLEKAAQIMGKWIAPWLARTRAELDCITGPN